MSDAALRQQIKEILIEQARIRVGAPKAGGAVSGGADSGGKLRKSRKGGDWASFVINTMNHPDTWGAKIQNEITNPDSDLRAKIIPVAQQIAAVAGLGMHRPDAKTRTPVAHAKAVQAVMRANPGMKLGDASKYVKQKGLAK
jgi:hypothetical protein